MSLPGLLTQMKDAVRLGPHRAMLLRSIRAQLLHESRRAAILDLGCGEGPYASLLQSLGTTVVGCDRRPRPPYPAICADVIRLPFRDESFDMVFSTQVLEHVPDPKAMLESAWRVLRPGGVLLMTAPQMVALHEAPYDFFRYTQFGVHHLLSQARFRNIEINGMGGFSSMVAQQLEFRLLWDRGLAGRWSRRIELGIGRLLLASIAAIDWNATQSRYTLNMIARAEK